MTAPAPALASDVYVDLAPGAAAEDLAAIVAGLGSVSLAQIQELADLQTRIDRKYVVPSRVLADLLADQDGLRVLEIAGLRRFGYESVYFDTPDLHSYRGAAHGRRRRFKVRTRTYADSGECVFEVKVKGGRGETVKERLAYDRASAATLEPDARAFAEAVLSQALPDARSVVEVLEPTLVTTYDRTTLVDPVAGTRLTCDASLLCTPSPSGRADRADRAEWADRADRADRGEWADRTGLGSHGPADGARPAGRASLGDQVVLESKSPGTATAVDRWLWARGYRPVSLSKYCVGLAALDDALPSNKWSRTLRRHVV